MKKISFYLLLVMCLFITGCGSNKTKSVATLGSFESKVIENGFSYKNNKDSYEDTGYIVDAGIATLGDTNIEMIIYSDSDTASKIQDNHIENFNLVKSTGAHVVKEKGSNYYEYTLISNGRYMVSSRVDNTLIFTKSLLKDKDIIETIINGLGY